MPLNISVKELLEAGVHFGHERKRWNPKFSRYIYAERNGIHIIDLQKTMVELERTFRFLEDLAMRGARCSSWAPRSRPRTSCTWRPSAQGCPT